MTFTKTYTGLVATHRQMIDPLLLTPRLVRPRRRSRTVLVGSGWGILLYVCTVGLAYVMALMFTVSWDVAVIFYAAVALGVAVIAGKIRARRG